MIERGAALRDKSGGLAKSDFVLLSHGDGGRLTHELVHELFYSAFDIDRSRADDDAAVLDAPGERLAFSTDSFVVRPLFFSGGDIGELAVYGTVNDLVVCGARPLWLSAGFIITEGLPMATLARIAGSMGAAARRAGVSIVAGDTKVVEGPDPENLYINTSGIGCVLAGAVPVAGRIGAGDLVLVTGTVGDHGAAILASRLGVAGGEAPPSDCAPLTFLLDILAKHQQDIKMMRDPTRGGLATTIKELALLAGVEILLEETDIPVAERVRAVTEILGVDPLYLPSEGRAVMIVGRNAAEQVLEELRRHPQGTGAAVIGQVRAGRGRVSLKTAIGGTRPLEMLAGTPLPRIC